MPKKPIPLIYAKQRYIMITNKRIYTLDPKRFDAGEIDKEKLVVNIIDIDYLSHIVFIPKESLVAFEIFH